MSMRLFCAGLVCTILLLTMPGHALAKKPADLPVKLDGKCRNDAAEVSPLFVGVGPQALALDFGFPIAPAADRDQVFQFWLGMFNDTAGAEPEAGCLSLDMFGPALWAALAQQAEPAAPRPECPPTAPAQRTISIPMIPLVPPAVNIDLDFTIAPRATKPQRGFTIEIRASLNNKPRGDAACDPHWLAQARHLYLIGEQCRQSGDLDMARSCYQEVRLLAPESSYATKAVEQLQELTCGEGSPSKPRNALRSLSAKGSEWTLGLGVVGPISGGGVRLTPDASFEEQETQSPGDWWQERFLKAAREIREERLRRTSDTPQSNIIPDVGRTGNALVDTYTYEVPPDGFPWGFSGLSGVYWGPMTREDTKAGSDWWLERFLKAAREIRAERLRQRLEGAGEEQEPPETKKQSPAQRMLEGTVPLQIFLREVKAPVKPLACYCSLDFGTTNGTATDHCESMDIFQRLLREHLGTRFCPPPASEDGWLPVIAGRAVHFYPASDGDEQVAAPSAARPVSTRLLDAARRLLDSLDIDIDTGSEQGVRLAINLGGQHYLFHYGAGGAWMVLMSPGSR